MQINFHNNCDGNPLKPIFTGNSQEQHPLFLQYVIMCLAMMHVLSLLCKLSIHPAS